MKLATNIWNARVIKEKRIISYCGFKTKHEALEFIEDWNSRHPDYLLELIKYIDCKWIKA